MEIELEESMRKPTTSCCSSASNNNNEAADFECNICLDLAQDPVVTLCGHLFCWPCLYRWLHLHSDSMHCPVCKALVEEDKLVPLYGRGKTATDPRSKSIISPSNTSIPHRPFGQRPITATRSEPPRFPHNGYGPTGGGYGGFHQPVHGTTRLGNFTLSSAFGGLIPSLFNLHFHGFPHGTMHGGVPTFSYGYPMGSFHGGIMNGFHYRNGHGNMPDLSLKLVFMSVCIFLIILLVFQ